MGEKPIQEQKRELREWLKKQIAILPEDYTETASRKIIEQLEMIPAFQRAEVVFCFIGTEGELDTRYLMQRMWEQGKCVAAPKCLQKGRMEARRIDARSDLEPGKYGILEPKEKCLLVAPENISFGIIPCLTCSTAGWRLGYGGGYYDRYLESAVFQTAAVCRERLLVEEVPIGVYDQRMDYVVTEKRWIACQNAARQ